MSSKRHDLFSEKFEEIWKKIPKLHNLNFFPNQLNLIHIPTY